MVDGRRLLADLQPLRKQLEDDLRERSEQVPELEQRLKEEWRAARQRERTAQTFEAWRDDTLAQAAVMWLLACVFVRFLEDNALIDPPRLAGPGPRLQLARDQRTLYFQAHPHDSDRDFLYSVFEAVAALPAAARLFDHRHNPIWNISISGDAATELIDFWQRIDPTTGALVHDFADPEWQTRFLGDLYQDLSESARKKYALLQTPDFVLQFILDRTLTPAIEEFGFREVQLIDPACGSGHFLLAAFERLFRHSAQHEPGRNTRELAQRALAQVSGVDLNPFAVAIARFRLLLAALRVSNVMRLVDAPAFEMELAAGDSLLHGPRPGDQGRRQMYLDPSTDPLGHVYATEDAEDLKRILGRRYHVVVGNPPYITPKDAALNKAYRDRFGSCYRQYSLGVPFTERFFDLAVEPPSGESSPAGYVGLIAANSFMKREFGERLIERFIPTWDLTHVIDTSGAYIPGHGTPTVILLGRHRPPVSPQVRAVLGVKGEPATPDDSAQGLVWSAIVNQIDLPGSSSEFISVSDTERATFQKHPWSIGGGGAAELKAQLDGMAKQTLQELNADIGFLVITGEDNCLLLPRDVPRRQRLQHVKPIGRGEVVRDWACNPDLSVLWPYDDLGNELTQPERRVHEEYLWPFRTTLRARKAFSQPIEQRGIPWWGLREVYRDRLATPLSIAFAFVATHNHFVLDHGAKVFKQSAPVIKLSADATEGHYLALLGILNSSTACFWMKQTFHNKGSTVDERGARQRTLPFEDFYEFTGTGLKSFPLPEGNCLQLSGELDALASQRAREVPNGLAEFADVPERRTRWQGGLERMIGLQEEVDWRCYGLYGLISAEHARAGMVPTVRLGERAFEILMARKMAANELETAWFERHGSTPITEIPIHWPADYRQVVERRIELIKSNPEIALIEQPEYKRRWNLDPWEEQVKRVLRDWLLNRLESEGYWTVVELRSVAHLADSGRQDAEFMRAGALYRGQDDFDASALVAELVESVSVPFLPVLRYRASGLRKREQWERTWDLQRREDAKKSAGEIPVPPRYALSDFVSDVFWQLRGKLDMPKERFISYPFCQRDTDPTPVIAWAGWDHLQQAKALATYFVQMKESEGWSKERLAPLLGGLLELLPWILQWHNELDSEYGQRMGEYFQGFLDEEARALGLTRESIRAWTPPAVVRRRGRRKQQTDD